MATTTKATTPKSATKTPTTTTAPTTNTETAVLKSQINNLESQVETLTSQVTNLTAAIEGKDIDGDGIPDVAGLTVRLNNVVNFLGRKFGQGPMENNNVY
jgi:hypothetical protein